MTVFEDEIRDMTQAAKRYIPDAYPVGPDLLTEFPYGDSKTFRTDLAGVDVDPEQLRTRANRFGRQRRVDGTVIWEPLTSGDWKMQYVKPYLWLRELAVELEEDGNPLTRSVWRDRCRWSMADDLWDWLTAKSYIVAGEPTTDEFGFFLEEAEPQDVPLSGDQWAFELKPRDWQHAYVQAKRSTHGRNAMSLFSATPHRRNGTTGWADAGPEYVRPAGYANFAVVVIDADHIGAAEDHADVFEQGGVGLASLDRDGIEEVVAPSRHEQEDYTQARLHLNERSLPRDFEP